MLAVQWLWLAACSASASEAKTLHASAAATTRSTHTLSSDALCVESVIAECPSPAYASPSASARQHQSSPTAAWIRRGSLALWPRKPKCECAGTGNRAKAPRDDVDRHHTTATFCITIFDGGVGLAVTPFRVPSCTIN